MEMKIEMDGLTKYCEEILETIERWHLVAKNTRTDVQSAVDRLNNLDAEFDYIKHVFDCVKKDLDKNVKYEEKE